MKTCSTCKQELPLEKFYTNKAYKSGYSYNCKSCSYEYVKNSKLNNPERMASERRRGMLKRNYGLTVEQYNEMLESQGNGCAICGSETGGRKDVTRLAVDHCHNSGQIRGLLCVNCNNGLGRFKDSIELLEKAIDYLAEIKKGK